jgi:hypothetical protein
MSAIWGRNITDEVRFRNVSAAGQADRRAADEPALYGVRLGFRSDRRGAECRGIRPGPGDAEHRPSQRRFRARPCRALRRCAGRMPGAAVRRLWRLRDPDLYADIRAVLRDASAFPRGASRSTTAGWAAASPSRPTACGSA